MFKDATELFIISLSLHDKTHQVIKIHRFRWNEIRKPRSLTRTIKRRRKRATGRRVKVAGKGQTLGTII